MQSDFRLNVCPFLHFHATITIGCLHHYCSSQEAFCINHNKLASFVLAAATYLPTFCNGICSSNYYMICILSAFNKIYLSWVKNFDLMTADKLLIVILFFIRWIYQNHIFLYWLLSCSTEKNRSWRILWWIKKAKNRGRSVLWCSKRWNICNRKQRRK